MTEMLKVETDAAHDNPNSLVAYMQVIASRGRVIMLVTFLSAVITACVTLFLPNIYTARSMILPAQEDKVGMNAMLAQFGGLISMAGGAVGAPTTGDLYVTMLRSETVKDPIIDRFRLMDVFEAKYRADAYRALDNATSVSLGRKDGVISIAVSDENPKRAAEVANAYIDELGKLAVTLSVQGAGKSRTFLESRLAEAKGGLAGAEEALKAFQAKNKTIQLPHQAEATIRGVAEMKAALVLKEVELSTLRRSLTDSSQEVKDLKTAIANLKSQIASYETGKGGGAIPALGSVPELGQEYVRLMREFKIQETLVELLTKQYEMTRLTEAKDYSSFQVLQSARVPEKKSKPQRLKIVLLATISTFILMLLSAFIQDYLARMPEEEKSRWKEIRKNLKRVVRS